VLFSSASPVPLYLATNRFITFRTKTANYTMTVADELIECDATTATFTVTLPDARLYSNAAKTITKTTAPNTVNIASVNNQTINGVNGTTTPIAITAAFTTVVLRSDGSNWIRQQ
jgi:hypothetical protein